MLNPWLLIGLLFLVTYGSRIIGIEIMAGRKMSPSLRLYFNYVPIAVITAIIVKQVLIPVDGELTISLPVLIGGFFTAAANLLTKRFLPSVLIGIIIGLAVRYFLL
ncbi:MAG: AzlD domain-containing protein [Desulfitobacteriia bacterium]|jgi:branched-subunit amino acid transport protein